jgi:hypothetical protein
MSRRTAWGAVAVAIVVLLGVAALALTPVDRAGYRKLAGQATGDSRSAVRTLARATRAEVTGAYLGVVARNAQETAASALREFTAEQVPDPASRAVRERTLPLLTAAAGAISDTALAIDRGDRAAVRDTAAALDRVGDQLDALAEELR